MKNTHDIFCSLRFNRFFTLILLGLFIATCSRCSTRKAIESKEKIPKKALTSYEKNIRPMMVRSCASCHFPENSFKKMLDDKRSVQKDITEILYRIQLPRDNEKFIPFKQKRPSLTLAEIERIKKWKKEGMPD